MTACIPFRSSSAAMPALVLGACLGLFLAGCDETTSSHPERTFTEAQRASCPESPFKPEFPIAPKRSAEARIVAYTMEIYASRGKFINGFEGTFDPESRDLSQPRAMIVWNGKDAAGKPVPSGYYFIAVEFTFPETGAKENRTTCVFFINDADYDKME
jgi:hypothetical protein